MLFMKKIKKHHFVHRDPELAKKEDDPKKADDQKHKIRGLDSLGIIKRDLKKTILVILAFVAAIGILYAVQIKTDLLAPILRLFDL